MFLLAGSFFRVISTPRQTNNEHHYHPFQKEYLTTYLKNVPEILIVLALYKKLINRSHYF